VSASRNRGGSIGSKKAMTDRRLLGVTDHDRSVAGMTYVYPVVSRRAGGVSVGINLNPNNACNWRCIYCQVPNLTRGDAPRIDLDRLDTELRSMLEQIVSGDFLQRRVPESARRLNDISFSGNGEPTSASEFAPAVEIAGRALDEFKLRGHVRLVLITNGSLMRRAGVQQGVRRIGEYGGEVWFKLDRATPEGIRQTNSVQLSMKQVAGNLALAASMCTTWLQTCVFALDGRPPPDQELDAYLEFVGALAKSATRIEGVLLYGVARPSLQPEAARISALPPSWLEEFARRINARGVRTRLAP
jgi:wyosine [tRNA(Phe)-imidazoG37] synthetase (radical SAM superfamily)